MQEATYLFVVGELFGVLSLGVVVELVSPFGPVEHDVASYERSKDVEEIEGCLPGTHFHQDSLNRRSHRGRARKVSVHSLKTFKAPSCRSRVA